MTDITTPIIKIQMLAGKADIVNAVISIDGEVSLVRDYPIAPGTTTFERDQLLIDRAFQQQGKERKDYEQEDEGGI